MYKAETRGITVTVEPRFVEEESSPGESRYFFAYTVEIVNNGSEKVQLRSRHWRIIDGHGACQEVRGTGVVGKQPVLEPGESFCYTSGCPLTTPHGTMEGFYTFHRSGRSPLEVRIPFFPLAAPAEAG